MKKKSIQKLFSQIFIVGLIIIFISCSQEETSIRKEPSLLENPGLKHNEIVIDFFNSIETNSSKGEARKSGISKSYVIDYLNSKYKVSLEASPFYLFNEENGTPFMNSARILSSFDPISVVEEHSEHMSEYFKDKVVSFFNGAELVGQNPEGLALVVADFKEGVVLDEMLSDEEKQTFLFILDVYDSSNGLWSYVNKQIEQSNGRVAGINPKDYWKIPSADMVEGLAGGLLGGPVGALVGLAAGSITMVIGIWDSRAITDPLRNPNPSDLVVSPSSIRPVLNVRGSSTQNYNFYTLRR